MDEQVLEFLNSSGLQGFQEAFEREQITFEILEDLDKEEKVLESIFIQAGPRLKFKKSLREWKEKKANSAPVNEISIFEATEVQIIGVNDTPITSVTENRSAEELAEKVEEPVTENSICEAIVVPLIDNAPIVDNAPVVGNAPIAGNATNRGPSVLCNRSLTPEELTKTVDEYCVKLRQLLESSKTDGKTVLTYLDEQRELTDVIRTKLVALIVNHELVSYHKFKVPSENFKYYSLAIEKLFLGEKASIYFVDYVYLGNKKKKSAKGKLIDKYGNRRSSLRRLQLLSPVKKAEDDLNHESEDDLSQDEDFLWLENNIEPWPLIQSRWEKTFPLRLPLSRSLPSVTAYIKKFPCLQLADKGFELLLDDFKQLYPTESDNFHLNWGLIAAKILEHSRYKASRDKQWVKLINSSGIYLHFATDDKTTQLTALKLLPFLLSAPSILNFKAKQLRWKPTRRESLDGFIFEVKSPGDLENSISKRIDKMESFGLKFQPVTVIINSKENVSPQVVLETVRYIVPTPLEAFDVCFKYFFLFNLSFPVESTNPYIFMQKYAYKLPVKSSDISTSVEALAATLKL